MNAANKLSDNENYIPMKYRGYFGRVLCAVLMINLLLLEVNAQQQLGSYLQYQQHPEQVNPAYTLSAEQGKLYSIGRKQWMGIEGGPVTMLVGGHFKTKSERSSLGFGVLFDKIGPEKYTEANAFYGHSIRLSDNDYIGATVGLGVRFYNVRYASLEQSDVSLREDINEKVGSLNLSFMYYRPEQFYVGVSLPRLGTGEFKEVEVFRENYSAIAAYLFTIDEGMHIKAGTWLSWMENSEMLGNFSATAYFNRKLGIGVNYNSSKEFGGMASFALNDKLKFGYGYGFGVGSTTMAGARNGTHEISLSYHFSKGSRINLL